MRNDEKAGLTTAKPESTFNVMLNAIGDSLSDHSSSKDVEDAEGEEDDEDDPAGGKLSEDDEPGWVMGTISKTVQYRMERFREKQLKLDQLTQPRWGDAVDYLCESVKKYGMTEWEVPAVVQPQTADDAASSAPTTFGDSGETLASVPGKLPMPQVTSQPGSRHMRLDLRKPRTHKCIPSLPPALMLYSSPIAKFKDVEPIRFNPCISSPMLFEI